MEIRKFAQVLFSLVFLLLSCSGENLSGNDSATSKLGKMQKLNNRIDMEEAMNQVEKAIAFLDKEHPSEFKSRRVVNSVSILRFGDIKSSTMKSGKYDTLEISDTLAYVFNFKDSSGYVIISNDIRVDSPLLAFTKKGSLVNGETDNPGLALFLERLEGYVLKSVIEFGKTDEQRARATAQRGPYLGPIDTILKPLVPVEWGQSNPFNDNLEYRNCPKTDNGRVPAGCVATATAQIMSYWEYPTKIDNVTYRWAALNIYKQKYDFYPSPTDESYVLTAKAFSRAMVANLFKQIGTGVNMEYGCDGSDASTAKALSFLESKGFSTKSLTSYNLNTVRTALSFYKNPLIARGCNAAKGKKCHAWVIDGLARDSDSFYIHNNWGFDGTDNGYYPSGIFDPLYFNFQGVEIARVSR